jgi:hypothetical protein
MTEVKCAERLDARLGIYPRGAILNFSLSFNSERSPEWAFGETGLGIADVVVSRMKGPRMLRIFSNFPRAASAVVSATPGSGHHCRASGAHLAGIGFDWPPDTRSAIAQFLAPSRVPVLFPAEATIMLCLRTLWIAA